MQPPAVPPPVVVVGRTGGAHGVRGWLHVTSYTEPPDNLLGYRPWLLAGAGGWQPVEPLAVREQNGGFLVQLAGIDDRDAAALLAARDIAVPEAVLPALADGDFYWRDVIGMDVCTLAGQPLGVVASILPTGAHDVLEIAGASGRRHLVPFAERYVRHVDRAVRRIDVDWDPDF
jgi:16S rRNA processing protein RimM